MLYHSFSKITYTIIKSGSTLHIATIFVSNFSSDNELLGSESYEH